MALKIVMGTIFFLSSWAIASSLGALTRDYEWWDTSVIYQIYPRSFKDSDGDGTGDLNDRDVKWRGRRGGTLGIYAVASRAIWQHCIEFIKYRVKGPILEVHRTPEGLDTIYEFKGELKELLSGKQRTVERVNGRGIIEKIDYLKDIGVETLWIQPFYKSPGADLGYDVSNFVEIDPLFGTLDDFKKLIKAAHDRGMKLVLDFVPNHVSDQNEWFKKSEAKIEPYTDFFLWADPKIDSNGKKTYPNNWFSVFGGSGWTWSEKRKQYYFNQFSPKQPDLNFHCQKVIEALDDGLRFWLDLGVDGFRVDAIKHLVEAKHLKDEPVIRPPTGGNDYETLDHIYTQKQPENYIMLNHWRKLLQEYDRKDGKSRLLCSEDYDTPDQLRLYFGNDTFPEAQTPFFFGLVRFNYHHNATVLDSLVKTWVEAIPTNMLANWVLNNHDNYRVNTRLHADSIDSMNMLYLLLPGSVSAYYGDELGLEDSLIRADQVRDPNNGGNGRTDSRDPSRGPMIWDDTKNAGFTTKDKPWLPVTPHYWKLNVKTQLQEPKSHLKIFKRLTALRKTPVIKYGDLHTYVLSEWTYMYVRSVSTEKDKETIAVILNLGSESDQICAKHVAAALPETMTVHTGSLNSGYDTGDKVKISDTDNKVCSELRPHAGIVLTTSHGTLLSYSIYLIFLAGCANFLRWTNN